MSYEPLKRKLLNILFPIDCVACGQEDVWLCPGCLKKIPLGRQEFCLFCGQDRPLGKTCPRCAASHCLDGVFVCADYENKVIAELVKKLKYSFVRELGTILGEIACKYFAKLALEEPSSASILSGFSIVPIPLHKKRFNWRGFNQAEIIAEYFTKKQNLEKASGLERVKHKTPQAKLDGAARRENIKNCFVWTGGDLKKKNILLVDDVTTTGSTLEEAAKVLKAAGAGAVWGLVIAKG